MLKPPEIDYRAHPAFATLPHCNDSRDRSVTQCVMAIDAEFTRHELRAKGLEKEDIAGFEQAVSALGTELSGQIAALHSSEPETQQWLHQSVAVTLKTLAEELRLAARQQRSIEAHGLHQSSIAQPFLRDGITQIPLPIGTSETWFKASTALRELLRSRAKANPAFRQHAAIPQLGALGRSICAQLRQWGAWSLAEQYQGCPLEIGYLDLHYSHPGQSWYKNCYADVGVDTSPLSYMHCDYGPGSQKLVFYFAPVTPENGPFSFLPGSHAWPRSMFGHVIGKELDLQHINLFKTRCDDGYYRARFRDTKERARFAALPSSFQHTSHFGDDVLRTSENFEFLRTREQAYTATDTVVMFNGSRGIHRGGLCTEGERWAVHIGLKEKAKRTLWQSLRRQLGEVRRAMR